MLEATFCIYFGQSRYKDKVSNICRVCNKKAICILTKVRDLSNMTQKCTFWIQNRLKHAKLISCARLKPSVESTLGIYFWWTIFFFFLTRSSKREKKLRINMNIILAVHSTICGLVSRSSQRIASTLE